MFKRKTGNACIANVFNVGGNLLVSNAAFTMAEILLSLTIIGVVAAITLPSLMGNINERTWNTQRKALYSRVSQAVAMMPQLNGYGAYSYEIEPGTPNISVTEDTAAEAFLTEGLSKVFKINNICDNDHLEDCGIPATYNNLSPYMPQNADFPKTLNELNGAFTSYTENVGRIDTKVAAFETQNGESVALFYNPQCMSDMNETNGFSAKEKMCANFVYDLNGNKGPNTFGKDMGVITAFYSIDPVIVSPFYVGYTDDGSGDSRLTNLHEAMSLCVNQHLIGINEGRFVTTTSVPGQLGKRWGVWVGHGCGMDYDSEETKYLYVKR